jgi:Family of unknown function (DUF6624)
MPGVRAVFMLDFIGPARVSTIVRAHLTLLEFMRLFVTTPVLLAVAFVGSCATRSGASRHDPSLRRELLAMCEVDQKVRQGFGSTMSAETVAEMQAVDARHTSRLRAIVAEHGWPGRSLVGDDGSHAAWLLVQHADGAFMAQCLPLMERAVAAGQAFGRDYVYLLDRVRMQQGKPQVYGTQFTLAADGQLVLHPIEDAEHVDERRRAIGLPPMAEQEKVMREVYR